MNQSFLFSIEDVAKKTGNPLIATRPKMFAFLRQYGIIKDLLPQPEFVCKGYFTVEFRHISKANKTVPVIRVSKKGMTFIQKFAKLIYE
ncbi:phage antirepressor KilAC domain-containing protein [Dyadobacter frigoris]|uniref:Antirepressor protein C-terminal domain-containing protein n=1 Tax=Dyadobacter frigoris TaxID=2576211 RepID=A0A4V6BKU3_9BACT|nr:phage antirepressor KilAC domain-containing protein [Dyadobacter frigoris]TKT94163.1 hypothetical protein FDK13_02835 [Dyadobacter frigoris]